MTFPESVVSSRLPSDEFVFLARLLGVHFVLPLPYPLSGAYFEEMFAAAVGGHRATKKLLFDVYKGDIGWSLKTLLWHTQATDFELVLQRCDILSDRSLTVNHPVSLLGQRIVDHFNQFCLRSLHEQQITDPRAAFLIRNRAETDFVLFQQRLRLYGSEEISWRWANSEQRSLMGYAGDQLIFRWYRSGTQLFGVYPIPPDAHRFAIEWHRADLKQTVDYFQSLGVLRLKVDGAERV